MIMGAVGRNCLVADRRGRPALGHLARHGRTFTVRARELDGAARAGLWPELVAEFPDVGRHQARTARQIPVFMLTRPD
jgi:F420H(2)-dependent quinone reductase